MYKIYKGIVCCTATLVLFMILSSPILVAEEMIIVILPFENSTGLEKFEVLEEGFRDLLTSELSRIEGIKVVERSDMMKMLKEHEISLSGFISEKDRIEVGRLLGANITITGGFVKRDSKIKLNCHLFETETTKLIKSVEVEREASQIIEMQKDISRKIAQSLNRKINNLGDLEIDSAPDVNLHFIRGLGYYYGNLYEYAIAEFMNVLTKDKKYDKARFWLGKSYIENNELDHARIELNKYISEFPEGEYEKEVENLLKKCETKKVK